MEITKKDLDKLEKGVGKKIDESGKRFKRHTNVLYKKFHDDIKIIVKGWDANREKTDATFNVAGEMKGDIEIIKMDIFLSRMPLNKKQIRMN